MQGYGQQVIQNQALAEALANQEKLQQRQQASQSLMNNSGHGGLAGILGAALGGYMNKKKGDEIAQGNADIDQQIAQIQAQTKTEIEAKKQAALDAKWQREDMIRAEKALQAQNALIAQQEHAMKMQKGSQAFTAEQNDYNRQSANNRFDKTNDLDERRFNATENYRRQQLENEKSKQGLFTPEEQALIEQKPHLAQEIIQRKEDKATGVDTKAKNKAEELKRKLSGSVNDLYSQLMSEGTETWGSDSKKMKTTYTDLLMQAKEAYNLGVLSGPDLELMENVINNPTSMASGINPWAGGNIRGQLKEFAKRFELQDPEDAYNKPKTLKPSQLTPQDMQATLMKY